MKKVFSLFVLILSIIVFSACAQSNEKVDQSAGETNSDESGNTIKVSLLTALSGPASPYGGTSVNVAEMAIKEINDAGGLLGKKLELMVGDTGTDPKVANEQAKIAIDKNKADVVFIQASGAERDSISPIAEEAGKMYFFTPITEYVEAPNLYINGETPSQIIEPVVPYVIEEYDTKKWYIVGNDYKFPRDVSNVLKETLSAENAEVVGEEYVPMGTSNFSTILTKIQAAKPDMISMELIGSDAIAFIKQLRSMGLDKQVKIISFVVDEDSVKAMGEGAVGMIEPASYFYNLETEENKKFLERYNEMFGENAPRPNFISNGPYDAIHMWALAVKEANSLETEAVKEQISKVSFVGPRGEITFDEKSKYANLSIYLGEVQSDLEFKVVKDFGVIKPQ
ncbi:substrate-binding protein [Bacillus sp. Marseille-P3661]|uniref:substrate-binding protein n=1 Tax=Bacillus sp. Marseille-P3661 TaxID=1936234 RepID=UPI0015E17501|nr:substrate-binding protein [Bacillus sp. Marseille-P3661]